MSDVLRMDAIHLPPRTREMLERALHERQMLQSLMQQNQQRIDDVLPQLRQTLLEMTWYANGIDAMIEKLAEEEAATLAGSPIAALQSWSAVFRALKLWLNAPLAGLNVPPTAVLAKRYTRKG